MEFKIWLHLGPCRVILSLITGVFEMNDGENPFVLLARITVKQVMIKEYLAIAAEAD